MITNLHQQLQTPIIQIKTASKQSILTNIALNTASAMSLDEQAGKRRASLHPFTMNQNGEQPLSPFDVATPVISLITPFSASKEPSKLTTKSRHNFSQLLDSSGKHDTRVVNEAFQDAVLLLEKGCSSKMQAEMLVLVDVLHNPSTIFYAISAF